MPFLSFLALLALQAHAQTEALPAAGASLSTAAPSEVHVSTWGTPIRGIHLTGWGAGSTRSRRRFIGELKESGLNAVAIALKEYDGYMFVRDVPLARQIGAFENAIPDLPLCVREFKDAGIYTIGRITLFKDNLLAVNRPELAVHRPDGSVWKNNNNIAWVDPYRHEVWDYNLEIASRAAAAGFDEIQFDYIRFPSDGNTKLCRYSRKDHTQKTAAKNLSDFLVYARERLKPQGVKISICVFGLTTNVDTGMGIGQHIDELALLADYVAPMMYPSHYHKGEMGVKDPNREPYKTIHRGLVGAISRLGANSVRLRPYLQDFTLGFRYHAEQVRAQILAAQSLGVQSWMLWNPQNKYTWAALRLNNESILNQTKEPSHEK